MTLATQRLTFAEYLVYDDGTDTNYELVSGELVPMGLGTGLHGDITEALYSSLQHEVKRLKLSWAVKHMTVGVQSPRGGAWDTSRIPDITVLQLDQWKMLRQREAVITLDQPPPLLVVEVVSPSTKRTDYRANLTEYAVLNIGEYWVVDPLLDRVTVCLLVEGSYDTEVFEGTDLVKSPLFAELNLTAKQILLTES